MDGADPDHPPEPLPPTTEVFLNVYDVVPPDGTGGPAAPITRLNNLVCLNWNWRTCSGACANAACADQPVAAAAWSA
jgi:hypothetical protein